MTPSPARGVQTGHSMSESVGESLRPLRVVDGLRLPKEYRDALSPGAVRCDSTGHARSLPRFFYEIESWEHAMSVRLSPNFGLWEFVQTDVREAHVLQTFPRYVPCALPLLALALEQFRNVVDTFVHIEANGGYRSPAHHLSCAAGGASTHCWGTAVNIYRIGDTMLHTRDAVDRFARIAGETIPGVWIRPFGPDRGKADDHLHIDLGYVVSVPRDAPAEPAAEPLH
jgi:hypothetical protein